MAILKKTLRIDLKWREMRSKVIFGNPMRSKVIFGHPKCPPTGILWKKLKVAYWSEMARNAIESDFRSSKMAASSHLVKKKNQSCVLIWNAIKSDFWSSKMGGGASKWPACKPFRDIHSICPWANAPILVFHCNYVSYKTGDLPDKTTFIWQIWAFLAATTEIDYIKLI